MQAIFAEIIYFHHGRGLVGLRRLDRWHALADIIRVMKAFWDNDARMVRAILAGDTAAWQAFILQYSNFIYRAIVRYTDDYDEKMEVYLHVLEKLRTDRFERLRRFAFQAKLSTWLTVVARRLALDFLRARYGRDFSLKKVRVLSIDGQPDYTKLLSDLNTPETELAESERMENRRRLESSLHAALDGLDDRERLAVQLVYFQGMRINEVGRLLKLPAAYKFLSRALKKIRAGMESKPGLSPREIADALEGEAHE
jgi:RNA polymerase sigma factor (sigma-70 family)